MALIETPNVKVYVGATWVYKVTVDPVVNVTGWTFQLTIRVDPDYKALLAGQRHLKDPDPSAVGSDWSVGLTSTDLVTYTPASGIFGIKVPRSSSKLLPVGTARGILDIVRTDVAADPWPVFGPAWADLVPMAYPLT